MEAAPTTPRTAPSADIASAAQKTVTGQSRLTASGSPSPIGIASLTQAGASALAAAVRYASDTPNPTRQSSAIRWPWLNRLVNSGWDSSTPRPYPALRGRASARGGSSHSLTPTLMGPDRAEEEENRCMREGNLSRDRDRPS